MLKPDAQVLIVVGDNRTDTPSGRVAIRTTEVLAEIGDALGWRLRDRIPITVTRQNLAHARNSITENTVLWFGTAPANS